MTNPPPKNSPKDIAKARREARLAEALRANLRRRKAADARPEKPGMEPQRPSSKPDGV